MSGLRIGVDVGGTFTDLVAIDPASGYFWHHKQPSTPGNPERAILEGTARLLTASGRSGEDVAFFGHGTTVITNMILERKGARLAIVTTRGFRDVLELGRQARPHVYDYRVRRPAALAQRCDRFELDERIAADGSIVTHLDNAELAKLARTLAKGKYEAVAICFLHSYLAPEHENQAVVALKSALSEVYVTASHEVAPEYREFERFATTALNGFVGPSAEQYISGLESGLRDLGIGARLYTVTSNAGLVDAGTVGRIPVRTALSGPAAGVGGIGRILAHHNLGDLVTFDVGGTSTDIAILPGGRSGTARAREVAGHPVLAPMVDIEVIGAGGGSIARLDTGGALKVGPESAGAEPGPVAYGRGGWDATVTDAAVVLGRIGSGSGQIGDLTIDHDAAEDAVMRSAGRPLALPAVDAAEGILAIAIAGMARTIRSAALSRGIEPERLCLVAYGGAGPLIGVDVASALGIRRVVVPEAPGTLCARAILVSDLARDFSVTRIVELDRDEPPRLSVVFEGMRAEGAKWLAAEGITKDTERFEYVVECRYEGQNFEIPVPFDPQIDDARTLRSNFDFAHARTQGFSLPDRGVQAVTFRLQARSEIATTPISRSPDSDQKAGVPAETERRAVCFDRHLCMAPIYARNALRHAEEIKGPAVIEETTSTTVVPPGWHCTVLADGTLDIVRHAGTSR